MRNSSAGTRKRRVLGVFAATAMVIAACGGNDSSAPAPAPAPAPTADPITLSFAHSYNLDHAHHRCGAVDLQERLVADGTGIDLEIFPTSQLGPDTDRFQLVASGDIDIDLIGGSSIAASYPLAGIFDTTFMFDGPEHVFAFLETDAFAQFAEEVLAATGVRLLDTFWFGFRQFTANTPIRTPDDFQGLRMRFPGSPRYLANAEALGANAVAVAFEEVYLSLQQGVIDGQENPIPTIASLNLPEVQSHVSLTAHQAGFQFVVVSDLTWEAMTEEQRDALTAALRETRAVVRQCIEDDQQKFLDEWAASGAIEVVTDVDRAAFSSRAEAYFLAKFEDEERALYDAIRAIAP